MEDLVLEFSGDRLSLEICSFYERLKENIVFCNSTENINSVLKATVRKDQAVVFASCTKWGK